MKTQIPSKLKLTPPLLIHLSTQKKIRTEKAKIKKVRTKTTKIHPKKPVSYILITTGTAALLSLIFYVSSILSFICLGLTFWGILFTYIRTDEYTKKVLLDATAYPQQATLNKIIQELNYECNPIYLPPKYFKNPETHKTYIPKQNKTTIPTPEQIQKQKPQIFTKKPLGMLLTPPCAGLTKLFEKTLDTNFTRVNLQYLQQNMPKLLIENLEIAQNFEIETENNKIRVKIEHSTYKLNNKNKQQLYPTSPLSSIIACTLAKTTGKPIIIEKQQTSQDGKNETIEYHIIEEEEPNKP